MADFIKHPVVTLPDRDPEPSIPEDQLVFTEGEKQQIAEWVTRYPTADGAIMRTLWLAQEKFGWAPHEGMPLAARYSASTRSMAGGATR